MIAEHVIIGVWPDGTRKPITFGLGTPYRADTGEWRCPVTLDPLWPRLRDVAGSDSMQALCLAISLGLYFLEGFIEDGGQLLYESGEPFSFQPYGLKRDSSSPGGVA